MKANIFLFIASILICNLIVAQTKVCYNYDKAGNRILKEFCLKSTPSLADSNSVSQPITENLGEMHITLYPNPTQGHLTINITNLPDNAKGEIILSDMTGRLLIKQNTFRENTLLDLSSHPIGIYVLKIWIGDKVSEWKVIKE
ncbi:MAG: T9SS type A sorting domain-containing protein [Bacteroidota bacterium]